MIITSIPAYLDKMIENVQKKAFRIIKYHGVQKT